ncbi:MAG: sensor histidine kinase, partial [Bacteroidia bacterium]
HIKRLESSTLQLSAVNKELEAFSYSVSHDLRSPLRAIDGYSRILEEDCKELLDEEGKRLLGVIQYNAKRMGTLIDDLLAFSRLGRKDIQRSDINMQDLIEGALNEIKKAMPHKAEVKFGTLHPVKADYALISQVMINFISNAIKYSSKNEKPLIEIASTIKDGDIIYSIADNGVGFNMDYAHKLFGVFQRLHTIDEFEGTGVGLAIVQRVIYKHNGKVWAESVLGKGATFYFSIPQ